MTIVQDMAYFVVQAAFEQLSPLARRELKIRVLDALGCAIGAPEGEPIRMLQATLDDLGGGRESASYTVKGQEATL